MDVLGYADRFSVQPGQRIEFMVSATVTKYHADLIRLDRAVATAPAGRYEPPVMPSAVSGRYPGRHQPIHPGSYVVVPELPVRPESGLTVTAWVQPTLPARGREQGIVAQWSAAMGQGFGLGLDGGGHLALWLGDRRGGTARVASPAPLIAGRWYFVAGVVDPVGDIRLVWTALPRGWLPAESGVAAGGGGGGWAATDGPLLIGASHLTTDEQGKPAARGCCNGKIDRPRLWNRALADAALDDLRDGADPLAHGAGLVAAWEFSRGIATRTVEDSASGAHHGRTVNMPARGMIGHNWTGDEVSFRLAPEQYGAIHFHEDDLDDAGWDVDFGFAVPADLRSGVYAIRLSGGETVDFVPFYVRPAVGKPAAPILYLAPTNTYLAYGNERLYKWSEGDPAFLAKSTPHRVEWSATDRYLEAHPELGASVYDLHADGSGICYSSRRRPLVTMRPNSRLWLSGDARHFGADLLLVEWLEREGFAYDVVTDEDLHLEGKALLAPYRVILTGSHPEYWTTPMLNALEGYLADGGRLMYLGGNGFYWVTAMDAAASGTIEVRRGINGTRAWNSHPGEVTLSLTGEPGGLWRYRGRTPQALTGVGFASEGWGGAPGYDRLPDSFEPRAAFIFDGIGADEVIGDFGLVMGGAAGDEIDRFDRGLGTPAETLRLATTEGKHTDYYQLVIEDCQFMLPGHGGTAEPRVRADLTYLEGRHGGAVFAVGSINWIGSLLVDGGANNVSRVTGNVLRRFAEGGRVFPRGGAP